VKKENEFAVQRAEMRMQCKLTNTVQAWVRQLEL